MIELTAGNKELFEKTAKALDEIEQDIRAHLGAKGELKATAIKFNADKSGAYVQFEYPEHKSGAFFPVLTIIF